MNTILIHPSPFEYTWHRSKAGAVFIVNLHGLRWPPELRANPPRVRLLEDGKQGEPSLCEIIGEWAGAPAYYPEEWAPGVVAAHNPRPVPARSASGR